MGNIKNFKLFEQSYSDNLAEVLENDENNFIILKGDEVIAGYEYLEDCFTELSDILEVDGAISDEQRYEFDDYVSMSNVEDYEEQYEIDEFVSELLDKFEVVEPYRISMRGELVGDDYSEEEDDIDLEDYISMMSETFNDDQTYVIVGDDERGDSIELDRFESHEEAEYFIDDYKLVYNEYTNLRIISSVINENHDQDDELREWENEFTDDEDEFGCSDDCQCGNDCGDDCNCGDDCGCKVNKMNESWINTVGDIVGIADPTGFVDLINGLDYIRQGKYFYGLLSMVSIIPYAGDVVAKPVILLAKAGKLKGVTKALELYNKGDKNGALKLLKKGYNDSKLAKFLETTGKWGLKLKKIIDKLPEDKINEEEKSTIHGWIDLFLETSGFSSNNKHQIVAESNKIKTFRSFS